MPSANPEAKGGQFAPPEMVQLDARAGKPDVTPLGLNAPVWNVEARAQEPAPDRIENDRGTPAPAASEVRRLSQTSESAAAGSHAAAEGAASRLASGEAVHRDMDHVSKPAAIEEAAARVVIQSEAPVAQEAARAAAHTL